MTSILIRKILRDNWSFLLVVGLLLFAFEGLWARVTYQVYEDFDKLGQLVNQEAERLITKANKAGKVEEQDLLQTIQRVKENLSPEKWEQIKTVFTLETIQEIMEAIGPRPNELMAKGGFGDKTLTTNLASPKQKEEFDRLVKEFQKKFLEQGSGKLVQALIGGDNIQLNQTAHILSIGYVHPLVQIMLCIWAIGRAAGTIAGEIDRGTMELLLGQPIPRWRILYSHFLADWLTIPVLCLAMWFGALAGCGLMDWLSDRTMWDANVYLTRFPAASIHVAALLFAVSGYTTWLSAAGRMRNRVMGISVVVTLLQFLVDVIGQIWADVNMFRPFTVFYYYNPQAIITSPEWYANWTVWSNLSILLSVGLVGYGLALWKFETRDIPAPL